MSGRLTETDIRERFNITYPCCDSCHDDMDSGHEGYELEIDGQTVQVCCQVLRALHEQKLKRLALGQQS